MVGEERENGQYSLPKEKILKMMTDKIGDADLEMGKKMKER